MSLGFLRQRLSPKPLYRPTSATLPVQVVENLGRWGLLRTRHLFSRKVLRAVGKGQINISVWKRFRKNKCGSQTTTNKVDINPDKILKSLKGCCSLKIGKNEES